MATINTKQAGAVQRITQFGGIDRRGTVYGMDNLRLCADGSLRRRCGYAPILTLEGKVRGVWSGSFNGAEAIFAAAGDKLVQLDLDRGSWTEIGSIAAGEEQIALFLYRGKLCCMDGSDIYLWDGSMLQAASPYVPLVAREREATDMYNVYEPINLIGRQARFSFRGDGMNAVFYFGCKVASIVRVYNAKTGEPYSSNVYRTGNDTYGGSFIAFTQIPDAGTILFVTVNLHADYYRLGQIAACRRAVVYGGSYDDRILCWDGEQKSEMFCSRPVTEMQVNAAGIWSNTSGDLYFPMDCGFQVGDGQYSLRTACRHYDRLLIFTEGDAWMADFSSNSAGRQAVVPINSGVGCTAPHGAAIAGNDPLTVADGRIWRWSSNSLRRDECSAECISAGIEEAFGAQFSSGAVAYTCRERNEVWFADPSDTEGYVYIYHVGFAAWYRFSGIHADGFFPCGGDVGFWRGNSFFRFAEELEVDADETGVRLIPAALTLAHIDFGEGLRHNHLTRLALELRGRFPALSLVLSTDLGRVQRLEFSAGGEEGADTLLERPARSGRFRQLCIELLAEGNERLHLCALTLTAEPGTRK